jgi:DNA-binding NtrC family response regulator
MKRSVRWGIQLTRHALEPILGISPSAEQLRRRVAGLAGSREHVIFAGEPGTGKRFLALQLHHQTPASEDASFIEITPRTTDGELSVILFEDDRRRHEGILGHGIPVLSRGSTVFVRNVYDFGFLAQSRIARFLIQHERASRGGEQSVRVVFSIPGIWETIVPARPVNDSLDAYCRRYEQILVEPLRNRRGDIPLFVDFFLRSMSGGHPPGVDAEIMAELTALPFYDNVRELRNLLADALVSTPDNRLALPDIVRDEPAYLHSLLTGILAGRKSDLEAALHGLQKALIRRALLRCDNDQVGAAALLGLSDINFRYRLRKFNLGRKNSSR